MKFVWRMDDYTTTEITPYSAPFDLIFVGLTEPSTSIPDFSHTIFSSTPTVETGTLFTVDPVEYAGEYTTLHTLTKDDDSSAPAWIVLDSTSVADTLSVTVST